jgi:hypothetical protein
VTGYSYCGVKRLLALVVIHYNRQPHQSAVGWQVLSAQYAWADVAGTERPCVGQVALELHCTTATAAQYSSHFLGRYLGKRNLDWLATHNMVGQT